MRYKRQIVKDERGNVPKIVIEEHAGLWYVIDQHADTFHLVGADKPTDRDIKVALIAMRGGI